MLHKRLLPLVLSPLVLASLLTGLTLSAETPPPPASAEIISSEAQWQAFEKGLDLLAGGKARQAVKAFRGMETPLGEIAESLAALHRRIHPAGGVFEQVAKAIEAARRGEIPPATYQRTMAAARSRLDGSEIEDARTLRIFLCHLKVLSGETSDLAEMAPTLVRLEDRTELVFKLGVPYTAEAREARYQGKALHDVLFDAEGCARSVRLVEGGEPPFGLGRSILDSARWWVVEPYEVDGTPTSAVYRYAVTFQLQ